LLVRVCVLLAVVTLTPPTVALVAVTALTVMLGVPVSPPAVPVVFWLSVGNVQLARFPEEGVPRAGVTRVGDVANTAAPVPVSSVKQQLSLPMKELLRM
jgi:hypothetical protein